MGKFLSYIGAMLVIILVFGGVAWVYLGPQIAGIITGFNSFALLYLPPKVLACLIAVVLMVCIPIGYAFI